MTVFRLGENSQLVHVDVDVNLFRVRHSPCPGCECRTRNILNEGKRLLAA